MSDIFTPEQEARIRQLGAGGYHVYPNGPFTLHSWPKGKEAVQLGMDMAFGAMLAVGCVVAVTLGGMALVTVIVEALT